MPFQSRISGQAVQDGLGELFGGCLTAQIASQNLVRVKHLVEPALQTLAKSCRPTCPASAQPRAVPKSRWRCLYRRCPALSRAPPRRSRTGCRYSLRRHPQPADEFGGEIGEDVAEQVRGHDHVVLPRIKDELHCAGIHDPVVPCHLALVFPRHFAGDLVKPPVSALRTLALCTTVTFLRPFRAA